MKRLFLTAALTLATLAAIAQPRISQDLSGAGWKLWHDAQAEWKNDALPIAPKLSELPVRIPTGGWNALAVNGLVVNVPGTVEEYLQTTPGPEGDLDGVSWWWRELSLPNYEAGRRVILRFESIRHRAEIFIGEQLVGYEIVGNTPFEVDITDFVKPGEKVRLALRITDPGGNYDWRDSATFLWSGQKMPPSHAFGGISGKVGVEIRDRVAVANLSVHNLPETTSVNARIELENSTGKAAKRNLSIQVAERTTGKVVWSQELKNQSIPAGESVREVRIDYPEAKLWDTENPNLYICSVELREGKAIADNTSRRFGFRWFEVTGVGEDAMYRLNGKRIVLRSAISWGFWPVNGLFPTDKLAKRQVLIAKELGLNMLNFHRAVGNPNVLDYADELGLLYYEEPGGYKTGGNDPFTTAILREKVLRMARRDRSHPCLIIYNMMNETGDASDEVLALQKRDMADMHAIDPGRIITRTSAWAKADYAPDQTKIHLLPYDTTFRDTGWYDFHHAGGPAVWDQTIYRSPGQYYNNTSNRAEIVMYGEEGAISSPHRLGLIRTDLDSLPNTGWDGGAYLDWYKQTSDFINAKNLTNVYPFVDDLTKAMGRVSYEHQGRKIQLARLNDNTDAYVVNGWESELIENYSGIVDVFRHPKADPAIIAKYNRPLYIAVMPRKQIVELHQKAVVDFYLINEAGIRGEYVLHVNLPTQIITRNVFVEGGDVYGQLLADSIEFSDYFAGMHTLSASLRDASHKTVASGQDQLLVVDLKANALAGNGAVWENGTQVQQFLEDRTQQPVQAYSSKLGKLDWVIVTRTPEAHDFAAVPTDALTTPDGRPGVEARYFSDQNLRRLAATQVEAQVNFSVADGATPHPAVRNIEKYGAIWRGRITAPASGTYSFDVGAGPRSGFTLIVDGKEILARTNEMKDGRVTLEAGKPVDFELRFTHGNGDARCRLMWAREEGGAATNEAQQLLDRARNDGTRIYVIDNAARWAGLIAANSSARFDDQFTIGSAWLGGVMFNRPHPIFKGLPQGDVLNWPYQALVRNGGERTGLVVSGEELLVGAWHSYPFRLGTTMGRVKIGKGSVLFSTLDMYDNIVDTDPENTPALVAKKLLLNMIDNN